MTTTTREFIGGPLDGLVQELPDNVDRVSAEPLLARPIERTERPPFLLHWYRLELDGKFHHYFEKNS